MEPNPIAPDIVAPPCDPLDKDLPVLHQEPPVSQPQVQVVGGNQPTEMRPTVTRSVLEMSEEERETFFRGLGKDHYKRYLQSKESGCFNRCPKTDWCKIEREKKEKEEQEKEERVRVLEAREVVWLEHAREQEAKMKKMERDMEKMAGLLAQLISKA